MDHSILFSEFRLNSLITLKNRIVMAPMTRVKATAHFVPTVAMADYYSRRADAGLILTEGTIIAENARGHDFVPGIFNQEQINAWKLVTAAVHAHQGLIFSQIWHVGRVSHPQFLSGVLPVSASATHMSGPISRSPGLNFGESRAASTDEITTIINDYKKAAENAMIAGFDGIEIHGANGYLIDQFLHYDTNHRVDNYGGSPENMARFCLEVVKACGDAIGYERVGLRLSPGAYLNQIKGDPRDKAVFMELFTQLNNLALAYVHTGNFNDQQTFPELDNLTMTDFIRVHYQGNLIACGSYSLDEVALDIAQRRFDLIAIGRPFIANPDLIQKLKNNEALTPYDVSMLNELY